MSQTEDERIVSFETFRRRGIVSLESYRGVALLLLLFIRYGNRQKLLTCQHSVSIKLPSLFQKICVLCGKRVAWPLGHKQRPLL